MTDSTKFYTRAYMVREEGEPPSEGTPIRYVASTENVARDGYVLEAQGWRLDRFRRNPVFLWAHDYLGRNLPIGKAVNVEADLENGQLIADIQFDQSDPFARQVEGKYRSGFLNAVSVGWDTISIAPGKDGGPPRITGAELLDISAVPVPGDPDALIQREFQALSRILRETGHLRAIPPHTTPKASDEASWDAGREVGACPAEAAALRRMHAWVDDEADPDTKQAYKLPHHLASGEVVWRGVAAAMARLLQAATQIPDADRRGVYQHLTRHYQQFDKEPPEFRTIQELEVLGPDEIRGLFLEGEIEMEQSGEVRVGAVLSQRNLSDLQQAVELIQGVVNRAKKEEEGESDETARLYQKLLVEAFK